MGRVGHKRTSRHHKRKGKYETKCQQLNCEKSEKRSVLRKCSIVSDRIRPFTPHLGHYAGEAKENVKNLFPVLLCSIQFSIADVDCFCFVFYVFVSRLVWWTVGLRRLQRSRWSRRTPQRGCCCRLLPSVVRSSFSTHLPNTRTLTAYRVDLTFNI